MGCRQRVEDGSMGGGGCADHISPSRDGLWTLARVTESTFPEQPPVVTSGLPSSISAPAVEPEGPSAVPSLTRSLSVFPTNPRGGALVKVLGGEAPTFEWDVGCPSLRGYGKTVAVEPEGPSAVVCPATDSSGTEGPDGSAGGWSAVNAALPPSPGPLGPGEAPGSSSDNSPSSEVGEPPKT